MKLLYFIVVLTTRAMSITQAQPDKEMFLIKYKNGKHILPVNIRMDYKNKMEYVMNLSPQSPEKSLTMYDFNKRAIAFKDIRAKQCFISKMQFETIGSEVDKLKKLQNEIIVNNRPVTLYANNKNLSPKDLRNLAGAKISRFCHKMQTSLISGTAVRNVKRSKRDLNYNRKSYGHYGRQSQEYEHRGHETYETGKGAAPDYKERRQPPTSYRSESRYRSSQQPSTPPSSWPTNGNSNLKTYQSGGYSLNQPLASGGSLEAGYRATGQIGEGHSYLPEGVNPPFFPPSPPRWPDSKSQNQPGYHRAQTSVRDTRNQKSGNNAPPTSRDQVYRFPYKPNGSAARPAFHPEDDDALRQTDISRSRKDQETRTAQQQYPQSQTGAYNDRRHFPSQSTRTSWPDNTYRSNGATQRGDQRSRDYPSGQDYQPNSIDGASGGVAGTSGLTGSGEAGITSETKVKTGRLGMNAEASSTGSLQGQRSQTQVQGAHAGNGTFSAQAQAGFVNGNTQSQVRGGRDGGSSLSSASVSQIGSAQSQVQVGTPEGTSSGSAQGTFVSGGTEAEASGHQDGGSAQAQSQSGGMSQSSAQVDSRGEVMRPELFEGEVSAKTKGSFGTGQSSTNLQGAFGTAKKYSASSSGSFDASSNREVKDFRNTPLKPLSNSTLQQPRSRYPVYDQNFNNDRSNLGYDGSTTSTTRRPDNDQRRTVVDQKSDIEQRRSTTDQRPDENQRRPVTGRESDYRHSPIPGREPLRPDSNRFESASPPTPRQRNGFAQTDYDSRTRHRTYNQYGRPSYTTAQPSKAYYDRRFHSTTTEAPRTKAYEGHDRYGNSITPVRTYPNQPTPPTRQSTPYYYRTTAPPTTYRPPAWSRQPSYPYDSRRGPAYIPTPAPQEISTAGPGSNNCCQSCCVSQFTSCCPGPMPLEPISAASGDSCTMQVTCYTVYKTIGRARICQPGC